MKITIDIDAARSAYRKKYKKKISLEELAEIIFKDERISTGTGVIYLSMWNSGKRIERCNVKNILQIQRTCGIDLQNLITTT